MFCKGASSIEKVRVWREMYSVRKGVYCRRGSSGGAGGWCTAGLARVWGMRINGLVKKGRRFILGTVRMSGRRTRLETMPTTVHLTAH